jgi:phage repressor protein C with HTH and peptisase S24 domain
MSRLFELLELRGLKAADLARSTKVDPSTISKLVKSKRELRRHWAERFAPHLGVTPEDLLAVEGSPLMPPHSYREAAAEKGFPPSTVRLAPDVNVVSPQTMRRDLPVYGTAAGSNGHGAFMLNMSDVVDMVRRPPGLAANRQAYALYVEGESMVPAYRPGDLIMVDPSKKCRVGDRVVVVVLDHTDEGAEHMAYVKELVKDAGESFLLKQFNPPMDLTFDKSKTVVMHRILTTSEMMGFG